VRDGQLRTHTQWNRLAVIQSGTAQEHTWRSTTLLVLLNRMTNHIAHHTGDCYASTMQLLMPSAFMKQYEITSPDNIVGDVRFCQKTKADINLSFRARLWKRIIRSRAPKDMLVCAECWQGWTSATVPFRMRWQHRVLGLSRSHMSASINLQQIDLLQVLQVFLKSNI
jgi:hypothetical protein